MSQNLPNVQASLDWSQIQGMFNVMLQTFNQSFPTTGEPSIEACSSLHTATQTLFESAKSLLTQIPSPQSD